LKRFLIKLLQFCSQTCISDVGSHEEEEVVAVSIGAPVKGALVEGVNPEISA